MRALLAEPKRLRRFFDLRLLKAQCDDEKGSAVAGTAFCSSARAMIGERLATLMPEACFLHRHKA
jgi:hypothetical protein